MAATENKQPLPSKVAAMKARKRRKLNGKEHQPSEPETKDKPSQKTILKVEGLPWQSVSMPNHLDDYEGFFGLEELQNVDVVRDPSTGQVTFSSNSILDPVIIPNKIEGDQNDQYETMDDDEWSGFSDEPSKGTASSSDQTSKATTQSKNQEKKRKQQEPQGNRNGQKSNEFFQALATTANEDRVDVSAWRHLRLSPDTLDSLATLRFSKPTPIQQEAIPEILTGHDVIGKASTGSGKTLAFGIPILEQFLELRTSSSRRRGSDAEKSPLALILSPTRELAHQLDKHLTALCRQGSFEGPSIATLTGGLSVQKQQRLLKHADIVVGTPGRLWEVISEGQGVIKALKRIQFLIVDEADRLLSEGHFKEVEEILDALDRQEENEENGNGANNTAKKESSLSTIQRQTLVFSATFDRSLQRRLATKGGNDLLNNKDSLSYLLTKLPFREQTPKFIDVNPVNQLATGLKEGLVECGGTEKDLYLYTLLLLQPDVRTLVFVNSISAVKRLTPFLQNLNLPALGLHSGMPQKARLRSVERFTQTQTKAKVESKPSSSSSSILISTDLAARGLDIPNVKRILHYHLPRAADTYVHRSGRTARAGLEGSSILICAPEEVAGVRRLIGKVHAQASVSDGGSSSFIRTLDLDRRVVSRLKPRASLAKKLADTGLAKEKQHSEDSIWRQAAEDLGVDYASDSLQTEGNKGRSGRGAARKQKEKTAQGLSKAEVASMRAELKQLLERRVNVGVSEKYITAGGVDVGELLRQKEAGGGTSRQFLGSVRDIGLEDV